MANKLKPFLDSIISINQSAFVPKRLITDNALVAFEIFHAMKRRGEGKDGTIALKLDMSKAYDRVEWSFLERVMFRMGFSDNWVRRIMDCLSSVSFSFKINGQISGSVHPTRGLRQGDPISPYLFLLCADAFSTLLSKAARENSIHGARICRGAPRVSHLFFADDSILFARANLLECSKIAEIISTYERASGQKVNLSKTDVVFSKRVGFERRQAIVETLGVREVVRHEKYLGLPTIIGKSKKAVFAGLKERLWKKLNGWKEKLLSRPGKEVLIKAVAQAIPTYMMSVFKIPDGLLDEMQALIARFWWGSSDTGRKMHWHNWESMCLPKSMGGLGFRDLKCFNQAMLAKQAWRLLNDTNSLLHSVLKARYFKNGDFIDARRGYDPSYTWRSIWGSKSLLLDGLKWRVGNGLDIGVWEEAWLPGEGTSLVPTPNLNFDSELRVSDLIDTNVGAWNEETVREIFNEEEAALILDIPVSEYMPSDQRYWWPCKDGVYSVRSGYWLARLGKTRAWATLYGPREEGLWRCMWKLTGPPKLRHFIWRACKGSLAVKERLHYRHVVDNSNCQVCNCFSETIFHSLFECTAARVIWSQSQFADLIAEAPSTSFPTMFEWVASRLNGDELRWFCTIAWAAWFCRNDKLNNNGVANPIQIAANFAKLVSDYVEYAQLVFTPAPGAARGSALGWNTPMEGHIKINSDAHIAGGSGVGLGVVLRDSEGQIVAAGVRKLDARWGVEQTEVAAAKYGLQLAHRLGFPRVVLECDSMNVVRAINDRAAGFSPLMLFYEDIAKLKTSFESFSCNHVSRKCNTVAHLMARWSTNVRELVFEDNFPQSLTTLAGLDLI